MKISTRSRGRASTGRSSDAIASPCTPRKLVSVPARPPVEGDEGLVGRFKLGDESAFIAIMRRYRDMIFSLAFRVLHNRGDAEEMTQDTFVRAYHALKQFRGDAALSTWLYRIGLNVSRNRYGYFRRRMRHVTSSLDGSSDPDRAAALQDRLFSHEPDPRQELELSEFTGLIEHGVALLRPKYREVLHLRNALHCSYPEIGAIVGVDIGTVKSRIARARNSLRGQLTELYAAGSTTQPPGGGAGAASCAPRHNPAGVLQTLHSVPSDFAG